MLNYANIGLTPALYCSFVMHKCDWYWSPYLTLRAYKMFRYFFKTNLWGYIEVVVSLDYLLNSYLSLLLMSALSFNIPSPVLFWKITHIFIFCSMSDSNTNLQTMTLKETKEGVFILRQQLKWVIMALKFLSDWAPVTCHCESSHKENGIFRESCTLTLVNWSGGSEHCDRD